MTLWGRERAEAPDVAAVGDAIVDELSSLRDIKTPPALVASVMGKIEARPAPGLWALLQRPLPIVLRVSPLGMVGLIAAALAAVALFQVAPRFQPIPMTIATETEATPATPMQATIVPLHAETATATVLVRFALRDKKARQVALAGSWNGWSRTDTLLTSVGSDGLHTATVALPAGEHQYMFVVDGRFVTDPDAADLRPDGFGNRNAVLRL